MGSTKRVDALIFDFDGVIVDSETPGFQAWSEAYASHRCLLPFDKYSACIGTIGGFDLHAYLEEQSGRPLNRDELEHACNTRRRQLVHGQPLLPGIAACVSAALEKLGIDAGDAIAFEDSPPGILAAKRAGLFCIAIPNPLTKDLPLELADRRLRSLEDFNLDDV